MNIPKTYNHKETEGKIYERWEQGGFFIGKIKKGKKPFVISMPPPNATGVLHIGHAMFVMLQDLMIRYHRLKGDPTLWLPGVDHAAIATQTKVEKILLKEQKTRYDLGREEFLKRVDEFVQNSRNTIRNQIRKLGASCDWSRERFTLDKGLTRAVREIFVRMYNDGLIYRGNRIVNWCTRCSSTLADDEVEYREIRGKLYYIKYGPFVIATTRPETKLGDTGVAIHPDDKRYKKYIGKELDIDLAGNKIQVKVFADKEVDKEFGTGVIGVTPAHSYIDYEWARKYGLEVVQVIGSDGKMTKKAGRYAGLSVSQCREKFVRDLEKAGLIEKIEDYTNNLPLCYRCDTVIEPLISLQWFVDVDKKIPQRKNKSLKDLSLEVVKSGKIKIIPERFKKIYFHWMENLRPWCISRQIWYGNQIPVWYCKKNKDQVSSDSDKKWLGLKDKNEKKVSCPPIVSVEPPLKCPECGSYNLEQDTDTLDTWFSSGLWTFSTLGWPEDTEDLRYFHPTTVMETGYDILFFWVARMIIMSEYALGDIPFETVYLHGLVRDKKGRKMSKSLGNVIDPLEMIDQFGADAVRLSLAIGISPGNDSRIYNEKISGARNFVNKLWNISRYILTTVSKPRSVQNMPDSKTIADQWILSEFSYLIQQVTSDIENFQFSQAIAAIHEFMWSKFADWYIEISKVEKEKDEILLYILERLLVLLHPYIPFVTEEIWSKFGVSQMLIIHDWPKALEEFHFDKSKQKAFKCIQDMIGAIRNVRAEFGIKPKETLKVVLNSKKNEELVRLNQELIMQLSGLSEISYSKTKPKKSVTLILPNMDIYVVLGQAVDIKKEKKKFEMKLDELQKRYAVVLEKLENENFIHSAPEDVVGKEMDKKMGIEEQIKRIKRFINELG